MLSLRETTAFFSAAIILAAALAIALAETDPERARAGIGPVVNTTDDATDVQGCDGTHCSLREAILSAEAGETISFDIDSGTDPGCDGGTAICTITPGEALPALGAVSLTLDGYTQTGASPNTAAAFEPTNAQIRVVIDGSEVDEGSDFGLWVAASGVTIRGVSIVNFGDEGIKTGTFPNSVVVQGNFIGVLPNGETAAGNRIGISIPSSQAGNTVGGNEPAARNVVSGNDTDGIYLWGGSSVFVANNFVGTNAAGTTAVPNGGHGIHLQGAPFSVVGVSVEGAGNLASGNGQSGVALTTADANNIRVKGNRVGTAANGTDELPNQEHGVYLDQGAEDNTIGGEFHVDEENIIAFNIKAGVALSASAGIDNYIDPSATFSNGGLGTDLLDDGLVQANDADDSDIGPNELMNYPVVNSATWNGVTLTVNATLTSEPNHFYNMFIFVNRECDESGYGEGERFIASHALSLGASGSATFERNIAVSDIGEMPIVTMSASNPESTSEFSECEEIVETGVDVQWGDLDCSDSIDGNDATAGLGVVAELAADPTIGCATIGDEVTVEGENRIWGDVNCDGILDAFDMLNVLLFAANLPPVQETDCPALDDIVNVT